MTDCFGKDYAHAVRFIGRATEDRPSVHILIGECKAVARELLRLYEIEAAAESLVASAVQITVTEGPLDVRNDR